MRRLIITSLIAIVLSAAHVEARNKPGSEAKMEIQEAAPAFLQDKEGREKAAREAQPYTDIKITAKGSEMFAKFIFAAGEPKEMEYSSAQYYLVIILYPETLGLLEKDDYCVIFFREKVLIGPQLIQTFFLFRSEDFSKLQECQFQIILLEGNLESLKDKSSKEAPHPDQE